MKRTLCWIPLVAVAVAATHLAAAQDPAASSAPGATSQPAAQPAAQPATAASEGPSATATLMEAVKNSFVIVKLWYKKDTSETAGASREDWETTRLYQEYVDQKIPSEQTGVVLTRGSILVGDDATEDRFLDRIEVQTIAGEVLPAQRDRLLLNAPGVLLKVEAAGKLTPLEFAAPSEDGRPHDLLAARLNKDDDRWQVYAGPMLASLPFEGGLPTDVYYGFRRAGVMKTPLVVADEAGRPLGCVVSSFFDWSQKDVVWRGADLRQADSISFADLERAKDQCQEQLAKAVQEVVVILHQGRGEDYRSGPGLDDEGGPAGKEIHVYGVAVSDTEVLVPLRLDRKSAEQIDKIEIKLSPQERCTAEFVGAFQGFAAFLVKVPQGKLPAHVEFVDKDLPPMRPFWAASIRKKFGEKHVDLVTNRLFSRQRGYAERYHWYAAERLRPGAILVDFQGRLGGLYLPERREHEEELALERRGGDYGGSSRPEPRVFLLSELRDDLTDPAAHVDADIKVKPPSLAKRRAWLGVEYVNLSGPLAEQMKVETPTKDGRLGFLVNAVYPGSPAERLGVRVGDILLKIQPPGLPYPIDLPGGEERGRRYGYDRYWGGGESAEEELTGPPEPSWKSRDNFLTRALDAVGVGKTVEFTYYRPGEGVKDQTATLKYTIELAPPDFDSAAKWKNRKLGLTVKDVTYEIRYALNLKSDDPGVILANVERGSPTLVARIFPNEILTRLDDQPIASARQMRDLVAKAQQAGQKKVRLTILRMGRTRFADLNIGEYDPKDDEGLDEDNE